MQGKIISHYHILQELGAGAMGVVWKAHDLSLDRFVALKFLPLSHEQDPTLRQRLIREARSAASLDHPNICTIHEIDENADGYTLLAMAYYEGETLAARIRRGRLGLSEALNIVRQILAGLAHAHDKNVIHRDIKPSNIMIGPRGEVKIVDFGLAKLTGSTDGLTASGSVVGTVNYLAPELLLGNPADGRADIWSTAVLLYELLTGVPAFNGPSTYAVLHAITHDQPRSLSEIRPDIPAAIDPILRHALAKEPERRYQTADEFLSDLTRLAGGSTAIHSTDDNATVALDLTPLRTGVVAAERSILVLPFVNLGGAAEWEYFVDGLTDEIITDLSSIHSIRVISSTSAMKLKGKPVDLEKTARELSLQYVLEGAARISGNSLRLNAKLINPVTDTLEWAEKYVGTLEDIFEIQESLSRRIVDALKLKLTPKEEQRLAARPFPDIRAYEYYLKAKHEILAYSGDALQRALGYLEKGEEIIGENSILLAAKGQVYWQFVNAGVSSDPKYLEKARDCANRVLVLEPGASHGNRLLGLVNLLEGKSQEAVLRLKDAMAVDPNDPDAISWFCAICGLSGRAEQAKSLAKRLLAIDPLTPIYQFIPGLLAMMSGDYAAAFAPFEKALADEPGNPMLQMMYGLLLAQSRRDEDACQVFAKLSAEQPDVFFSQIGSVLRHALCGEKADALAAMTPELAASAAGDPQYAWHMAQAYALLGEVDEGIRWLGTAVNIGFINYPVMAEHDPLLANLRAEPAFTALMKDVHARWKAFVA